MGDSLEITFLKEEIKSLKSSFQFAKTVVATQARNALTALNEGDEDEVIEILKALAGED